MHGLMHKGYRPDGTYPSMVVYLDHEDVLCDLDPGAGCVGERRHEDPCPIVFYDPLADEVDPMRRGDEVTICPVHGRDVRVASVDELEWEGPRDAA